MESPTLTENLYSCGKVITEADVESNTDLEEEDDACFDECIETVSCEEPCIDADVLSIPSEESIIPCRVKKFTKAKRILQKRSRQSGISLYEHIGNIVQRVIDDRNPNAVDCFDEFSRQIKETRHQMDENYMDLVYNEPVRLKGAKHILPVLTFSSETDSGKYAEEENEVEEETEMPPAEDLINVLFYWKLAGYGYTDSEAYYLCCALRHLEESRNVIRPRFWGKIFGIQLDYYIVEGTLSAEEIEMRQTPVSARTVTIDEQSNNKLLDDLNLFPSHRPELYRPKVEPVPKVISDPPEPFPPTEALGYGANRYVYFVTTSLCKPWIELPSVTPQQIIVSRQIKKFLTGHLDARVKSYPVFPGTERNYLRALIARISAGTHICPYDFYIRNLNEDYVDDDIAVVENPDFIPIVVSELMSPTAWVHHKGLIHNHGRVKWTKIHSVTEAEYGPWLFISCEDDVTSDGTPSWTFRQTSGGSVNNSIVLVRSNVWPGAMTITTDRLLSNLYFGWGHKYIARHYSPPPLPLFKEEFDGPLHEMELEVEVEEESVHSEVIEEAEIEEEAVEEEEVPPPRVITLEEEPEYISTSILETIDEPLFVTREVLDDVQDTLAVAIDVAKSICDLNKERISEH